MKYKPGIGETQPNRLKKAQVWRAHRCQGPLPVSKRAKLDSSYFSGLLTCIPQNLSGWIGKGGEASTSLLGKACGGGDRTGGSPCWRLSHQSLVSITAPSEVSVCRHSKLTADLKQQKASEPTGKTHTGYLRSRVTTMPSSSGLMRGEIIKERPVLPWWLRGKESTCQGRRHRFDPWSGKIPRAMEQLSPYVTAIEPVL